VWDEAANHGRIGADSYTGCSEVTLSHPTLSVGSECPHCAQCKTVARLGEDGLKFIVRLIGGPLITGTKFIAPTFRCNLCKARFYTPIPKSIKEAPKYAPSCASTLAIARYSSGMPMLRIEQDQSMHGIPIKDSTQWDILKKLYTITCPVFNELQKNAANGSLAMYDDTPGRIIENKLKELSTHTTAFMSVHEEQKIHLFFTGQNYAGKNADAIFAQRTSNEPVIAMMDASPNNIPKHLSQELVARFILCFCLVHGRRKFFKIRGSFDKECDFVLNIIGQIYANDSHCAMMTNKRRHGIIKLIYMGYFTGRDMFTLFDRTTLAGTQPVLDPGYLDSLLKIINESYPQVRAYSGPEYPAKDLQFTYVKNAKKDERYQRYNPLQLRLAYKLEGYERIYDHTRLSYDDKYGYTDSMSCTITEASITYLNFLKQYNLAYIAFLQAINGSEQVIANWKELFTTPKMFRDAKVKEGFLDQEVRKPTFRLGMLAYLMLDIVFSKEKSISANARTKAMELVLTHFNVADVAAAFAEFSWGYHPYDEKDEPFHDMIPKRLINTPEEAGSPHNLLFLKNKAIKEMFNVQEGYPVSVDYHKGISILLQKYPGELAQIIQSFFKIKRPKADVTLIFVTLVQLCKLDRLQKESIFGPRASFLSGDLGPEASAGWIVGTHNLGEYLDEDELTQLTADELRIRVRQSALRIHQLEVELVEKGRESVLHELNSENDPQGYFSILLMHPKTPEEHFEDILKRNYRVLALKYHPDKGGDPAKFRMLKDAYDFFLDADNRKTYGKQDSRQSFGMGK
jgi:hypothetical protein